jgi:thioredoxin:protein disulfide reductase
MKHYLSILLCCLIFCANVVAAAMVQPLAVEKAFQVSATARDRQTILVSWKIASGYYLYEDQFVFNTIPSRPSLLSQPILPMGAVVKTISGLGKVSVYQNNVTIVVPVLKSQQSSVSLKIRYQGCSEQGVCYPPQHKVIPIDLADHYNVPVAPINIDVAPDRYQPIVGNGEKQTTDPLSFLNKKSIIALIAAFFGFGVLISLTPCVLPMIPILSSIIVGRGKITHGHSFLLSLAYVVGMALTYAIAGLLFGMIGSSVQADFQQPWIIVVFSFVFVMMALSLFGVYNLQLPHALRNKMARFSEHQKRGSFLGVIVMGVCSTLILSPCVTPPLVAVLGYVGQSGNAFIGFVTLLSMGFGMGLPLLLIGAFGPKFLPHRGAWMNTTKPLLGVLILAVAIWMLQRILPDIVSMLLWSGLAIGCAIAMGVFVSGYVLKNWFKKTLAIALLIYGLLLMWNTFLGYTHPLQPFAVFDRSINESRVTFIPVKTMAEVSHQLHLPRHQAKPVLLDFYAKWCAACKEMDATTFNDAAVKKFLEGYVLLRVDVTQNNMQDKLLQQQYGVVAPPTILLFDRNHREVKSARMIGAQSPADFLQQLKRYFEP